MLPCSVPAGDPLYPELWRACAGPLVTVPRVGDLVFYFPQGHIEQVHLLLPSSSAPAGALSCSPAPGADFGCWGLSGGGVHEPGRREPDAPLRSALQVALPRAQRGAQGSLLLPPCFFTLPRFFAANSASTAPTSPAASNSRPGAYAFSGFLQAETDTDEVYAQIMLMPEPEVASQLGRHVFWENFPRY
jgi:hypothetical protein